jgi:hypothetical protein
VWGGSYHAILQSLHLLEQFVNRLSHTYRANAVSHLPLIYHPLACRRTCTASTTTWWVGEWCTEKQYSWQEGHRCPAQVSVDRLGRVLLCLSILPLDGHPFNAWAVRLLLCTLLCFLCRARSWSRTCWWVLGASGSGQT